MRLVPSLKPVGTIRPVRATGYYKLSRLAVLKDYRRFSFGRALVFGLHDWVRIDAITNGRSDEVKIRTHSQLPVKGFYARQVRSGQPNSEPSLTVSPTGTATSQRYLPSRTDRCERYSAITQGDEFDEDGAPHQLMIVTIRLD